MADTSNLSNFLGDVADAIRTKKGTTETIPAANFDVEIASIETGSDISDATATENDILAGTTAYIADGKVEGNIQKIEEALDDTVVSSEIECDINNVRAYCKRHNLIYSNGYIINLSTGQKSEQILVASTTFVTVEFSNADTIDGNVLLYGATTIYGDDVVAYMYEIDVNTLSYQRIAAFSGFSYAGYHIEINPNNIYSFYVANSSNLYLCNSGETPKLVASLNFNSNYDRISSQWNMSNTKLLLQMTYQYSKIKRIAIYDTITSTCVTYNMNYDANTLDCTWYDDDTLLYKNDICTLSSSGFTTIKTLSNLKYTTSVDILHHKDTNLFIRCATDSNSLIAQVIDYTDDNIVSEEIVYSGPIGECSYLRIIRTSDDVIYAKSYYTENDTTKYKLIEVGIGAEKQITGLIRNGTQYHDTSRGNAKSGDILKGTTAYSSNGKLIGSMPNNGAINITPSTEVQTIPTGYTSGGTVGAIDYSNTLSPTEYDNCLQLSNSILNGTKPYVELAYIESSGTQYINTEYKAGINTKIMMSVMTTDSRISSGLFVQITGAKNSYHSSSAIQVAHGLNDNMVIIDYGTGGSNNQQIIPRNTKIDIIVGNNVSSVNGQMYSQTGSFSGTCSYPLWIFDCNDAGSHEQYYIGRVYYYKIYENDTLVRDFIPVKNILNNEICLYDKIENKFYYNSGSGNFIGGGN